MWAYILRRLLFMIPTLFGIMLISFAIMEFVPGGPVERMIATLQGLDQGGGSETGAAAAANGAQGVLKGSQGVDPALVAQLRKQFGFDKPAPVRFWLLVRNYLTFNFGESYFRKIAVVDLIKEKLPVSISLGLWMFFVSHIISIPLGVAKAMREGSRFDAWTSALVIVAYAVPSFVFAILMITLFSGGSFWSIFPLRGLKSENFAQLDHFHQALDYLHHLVLPVASLMLGSFATTTLLTKNSFLEEIRKAYVQTARMKGLTERRVLYGHVFRNAMLIVVAGLPGAFLGAFFTGALLIEQVFNLDGLGLLSYESILKRDYAVVLANLYIFGGLGLLVNLLTDLTYAWIDPRIDFESRGA